MIEALVLLQVLVGRFLEVHGRRGTEVHPAQSAQGAGAECHAGLLRRRIQTIHQARHPAVQFVVEAGTGDQVDGGNAGRHGNGIARQRARLVDIAQRCEALHDACRAGHGAHGHAAADDLAEGGQVWRDAAPALCPRQRHPKARHHLVEDQHGAILGAQLAQPFQETGLRHHQVHVAGNGLDDQAGHIIRVLLEQAANTVQIVVAGDERVLDHVLGHAGRAGVAEGQRTAARLHQQAVCRAVVAALELDDAVAARVAAGQPQGRHGGFRAGTGEAHPLDVREHVADSLRQLGLAHIGRAERQAIGHGRLHGLQHLGVRVANNGRPPRAHVIDVGLALHVPHAGALGPLDEARRAAHGPEGPHGRVDAAHQHLAGTVEFLLVGCLAHGNS